MTNQILITLFLVTNLQYNLMEPCSSYFPKEFTPFKSYAKSFRSADLLSPLTEFSQHVSYRFNCKFYTFTPKKRDIENKFSAAKMYKRQGPIKGPGLSFSNNWKNVRSHSQRAKINLDLLAKEVTPVKEERSEKVDSTAAKQKIIGDQKMLEDIQKPSYKFLNFQDTQKNDQEKQVEERKRVKERHSKKIRKVTKLPLVDRFNRKIYYMTSRYSLMGIKI